MEPALGTTSRRERVRELARCHALMAVLLHDAEQMVPSVIRPLGYPLFLRVLSVTGRFRLVPPTQHRYFVAGRVSLSPGFTALDLPPAGVIAATLLERRLHT